MILSRLRRRRSLILAYHGVGIADREADPNFLLVTPHRFRSQVRLLMAAGFRFVTVAELAGAADGGPPPPGLAALSFDDGMQDNHATVLPLLREWGIPATVYVVTGLIGRPNPWLRTESARMMTEDELRELAASGIELGAHTVSHPDLAALDRAACLAEMAESRDKLERIAGSPVRTLAYPYSSYGPAAMAAAREAGFDAAVTGAGRGSWDPYELKRVTVTSKDGLASFVLKLHGAYEPLYRSPPGRAVRAGTRPLRRRRATAASERRR